MISRHSISHRAAQVFLYIYLINDSSDEEGNLNLVTESKEDDYFFDEIGSVLKIKQIQQEKRELLESLEMYYKVFFLQEGQE